MRKDNPDFLDRFENSLYNFIVWLIKPFVVFFGKRKAHNKEKIQELVDDYEKLIQEYYLIREKKSKLSAADRKMVKARIAYLVDKGHIRVN